MKLALKLTAILLIFASLAIQMYILLILLAEIFLMGHTGVASAFGYGASFTFSPSYLIAITLICWPKIRLPLKWIHGLAFSKTRCNTFFCKVPPWRKTTNI